jgi:hypothetical protein
MNETHNGKIGRLPKAIQEQVNRRMESGEQGQQLADWLNSLPEVQALLAAEFEGKPVSERNLSEWRKRGYAKWVREQETLVLARQLAGEMSGLQSSGGPPLSDMMAIWVVSRYMVTTQKQAEKDKEPDMKALRELCHDIVALRRADQNGARLKIEQEKWEYARVSARREAARQARFERNDGNNSEKSQSTEEMEQQLRLLTALTQGLAKNNEMRSAKKTEDGG